MLAAAGRLARRQAAQLAEAAASTPCSCGGGSSCGGMALRQTAQHWQLQPSRFVVTEAGSEQAAVLAKARRMAGPVGVVAGVFGSIVGVGGECPAGSRLPSILLQWANPLHHHAPCACMCRPCH